MSTQSITRKVDALFEGYTQPGSPGCALAVMKDGQIVYKQGYGLANLEHNIPITPSTVFNIGSESKQFTALAILLLANEGRLSLDDDIRRHLPESPDFGQTITIRHLIHHTSGVRCSFPPLLMLGGWLESDQTTHDDVFRLFKAQRGLNFKPGEEHSYANMGYIVLATIVQRVTGQPFAAFCKECIFEPLGMACTVIHDNPFMVIPNCAQSYWQDDDGCYLNATLCDSVLGPTNVYTTVEDLARWDENFYTGQVGGMDLIGQMHQPGVLNDGTQLDYACGLMIHKHRGLKLVEHGGGHGGYTANLLRFPDQHFSAVLLCNFFNWGMRHCVLQVADLYLDGAPEQEPDSEAASTGRRDVTPVELSEERLKEKEGRYFHARRVAVRDVALKEGRLQLMGLDLLPVSENAFIIEAEPGVRVEFVPAVGDVPPQLRITTHMTDYRYDHVTPVTPSPDDLEEYAALYHSPELNVFWRIVLEDDHLVVKHQRYQDSQLTPIFTDAFTDDWSPIAGGPFTYTLIFNRDGGGLITGFGVSDDRMRDLRFVRLDIPEFLAEK